MPITASSKGGDFEPIEAGVYVAVCYGVIDLGTQHNETFNQDRRQVLIQWELPEVRGEFERDGVMQDLPRAISQRFTNSLSSLANLRKVLESWRGKAFNQDELGAFDVSKLIGACCQLSIIHEPSKDGTRVYANISAVMALPKGTTRPAMENPAAYFSFEDQPIKIPDELPEWVTEKIQQSREWRELEAGADQSQGADDAGFDQHGGGGDTEDDLPF